MISGTKEWAVAEINCGTGCLYDCRYCYARRKAITRGTISKQADWQKWYPDPGTEQRDYRNYDGQVMFPTAHDIFPENLVECECVIRNLLECGNRVLIVSKPNRNCIAALCRTFKEYQDSILFRFTLTARNPSILRIWEPGAPAYHKRLESLRHAYENGYQTSVSVEPILDMTDLPGMIEEIRGWVTHSIWLGKMNKIEQRVVMDSEQITAEAERIVSQQSDRNVVGLYERYKLDPLIKWKESIKKIVGIPLSKEAGEDR